MPISDWSADVCSSDLLDAGGGSHRPRPSRRMTRKETGGNGKALFPTPPPFPNRRGQFSLPRWIIRGLTRDGDIMDVAFRKARIGDLDEASPLLQILNGSGACIAHPCLHAPDKLMDYVRSE